MSDPGATLPPDALSALDDYTTGVMSDADAEAFEEALFARAAAGDAPEAEFAERLRRASEWIGRRATFNVGSTRAELDALLASGLRVHYLDFGDGSRPIDIAPLPPDLEIFAYRLGVDLRGYGAVDVVVETPSGEYIKTFRDVRSDPTDGALYGVCEAPLAEISFRRGTVRSKVMAGHGAERKLVATFETRPILG
ncbi:MAG TPA: hypothetical protein VGQ57_19750 [Polyangiaceae bacterium]|jgi:hypothetical protein|nr:hypothetical protein [Polyangiaceae bacterium]